MHVCRQSFFDWNGLVVFNQGKGVFGLLRAVHVLHLGKRCAWKVRFETMIVLRGVVPTAATLRRCQGNDDDTPFLVWTWPEGRPNIPRNSSVEKYFKVVQLVHLAIVKISRLLSRRRLTAIFQTRTYSSMTHIPD